MIFPIFLTNFSQNVSRHQIGIFGERVDAVADDPRESGRRTAATRRLAQLFDDGPVLECATFEVSGKNQ